MYEYLGGYMRGLQHYYYKLYIVTQGFHFIMLGFSLSLDIAP